MKKKEAHEELPEMPAAQQPAQSPEHTQHDSLQQEIESLKQQNGELVEHLQRLQAEFINYRNRVEREQRESKESASEKMLHEFLPVLDSLHLALQHAKDDNGHVKGEDLLAGLLMIQEQMRQLLEHQGLEEIKAEGERFDPRQHEAMFMVQQEGVARGTVIQTYQRGYTRAGKIFRPAKVSVAK